MATTTRRRPNAARRPAPRPRRHSRPATRRSALRRLAWAAAAAGMIALGVVVLAPVARKVASELGLPLRYQGVIRREARIEHLDPALIAGVIYAETKFDPRPSSAGAQGPMQLLPGTALFLARRSGATTFHVSDLVDPRINIAYGSYYLRYLLDEYHGDTMLALAAYNGGETNVDRWVARARAAGHSLSIADIPYAETRDYVQRVLQARQDYRRTYPRQLGYR